MKFCLFSKRTSTEKLVGISDAPAKKQVSGAGPNLAASLTQLKVAIGGVRRSFLMGLGRELWRIKRRWPLAALLLLVYGVTHCGIAFCCWAVPTGAALAIQFGEQVLLLLKLVWHFAI